MRYVFRADASRSIGSGHVMRSCAIAEELIARGKDVVLVGQILDLPWVEEIVASLGFSEIYKDPAKAVLNPESDILILDSYEIPIMDEFISPKNWLHVIAIADAQTPNYICELRIHPGLDPHWSGDSKIPILAGPKYIPFRASLSRSVYTGRDNEESLKIVVVAGGSDPNNLVNEIAKILSTFPDHFEVYLFSNLVTVLDLDTRFHYVEIGKYLDPISQDANLVLTTSSTSSLEFIARGLCVGIACAVENQRQYYESLGQLGIASQIGTYSPTNRWNLDRNAIHELVTSSELRNRITRNAFCLIDFKGASRIVDAIIAL